MMRTPPACGGQRDVNGLGIYGEQRITGGEIKERTLFCLEHFEDLLK
jgi:hypothetical protein